MNDIVKVILNGLVFLLMYLLFTYVCNLYMVSTSHRIIIILFVVIGQIFGLRVFNYFWDKKSEK